jgi:hypothetical protein
LHQHPPMVKSLAPRMHLKRFFKLRELEHGW